MIWNGITTDNSSGWTYYPSITYPASEQPAVKVYSIGSYSTTVTSNQSEEKETKMARGLFNVFVVDPDTDEVVHESGAIVAKSEDNARLKVVQQAGGTLTKDVDDYDIIVVRLGNVRDRKEVQQVKVVKE